MQTPAEPFLSRPASPLAAAFTRRTRRGAITRIDQFQLHATRGPVAMDLQVQATENWFANQPDRGGWGSSSDFVVGPDHRLNGGIAIVQFGGWRTTFSSWSAGYGSRLPLGLYEYGAAERGIAIEIAQPPRRVGGVYVPGDSDVPFTPETVEAVAWLCRTLNHELVAAGGMAIPAVRIPRWNQLRGSVPRGYIAHEDLANGAKLGKTDPGTMWPWEQFLALVRGEDAVDLDAVRAHLTAAERHAADLTQELAAARKLLTPEQ